MKSKDYYVSKARELYLNGYNCSQAVFCAYSDEYNIPQDLAYQISSSFGGGIGRMRSTCGTICGLAFLSGLEKGPSSVEEAASKTGHYKLVQKVAATFAAEHGSTICSELLEKRIAHKKPGNVDENVPLIYIKRPCLKYIESAASIWYDELERLKNERIEN